MPKGIPNKRYTGEFKQMVVEKMVVETMQKEKLSYSEAAREFDVPRSRVTSWECIYLEEGAECISRGLVYEGQPYHNTVIIGHDRKNKPCCASFAPRTAAESWAIAPGSDKHFSFRIVNQDSDSVHLFESAIDLLSYATLEKLSGRDWRRDNLVSLSGVYLPKEKIEDSTVPLALAQFLSESPGIRRIVLHLDNDNAGRSASRALQAILSGRYEVVDEPPTQGKDYNEMLCLRLRIDFSVWKWYNQLDKYEVDKHMTGTMFMFENMKDCKIGAFSEIKNYSKAIQ